MKTNEQQVQNRNMAKHRKQRRKPSGDNGKDNGNESLQPSANLKASSNGDGGFPPHLLRNHGHRPYENDASDDALETLVPNAVFVARHALSHKECQEWINYTEEGDRWESVSHPATKWIAHRE